MWNWSSQYQMRVRSGKRNEKEQMVLDIHQEQASARRRRCMKESLKIRATGNRQARDQGSQRGGRICLEKRLHELSLVLQRCSGAVVAFNAKVGGSTTQLCT